MPLIDVAQGGLGSAQRGRSGHGGLRTWLIISLLRLRDLATQKPFNDLIPVSPPTSDGPASPEMGRLWQLTGRSCRRMGSPPARTSERASGRTELRRGA